MKYIQFLLVILLAGCGGSGSGDPESKDIPQGYRIVFQRANNIYSVASDGSDEVLVANTFSANIYPDVAPDGLTVVFTGGAGTETNLYEVSIDGLDEVQLTNTPGHEFYPEYSPDGQWISYYSDEDANGVFDLAVIGIGIIYTDTSAFEKQWTPDNRILFESGGDLIIIEPDGTGLIIINGTGGIY